MALTSTVFSITVELADHRASKLADRVAVYTHRDVRQLLGQLQSQRIHRREEIPIYAFSREFIAGIAALIDRRTSMSLSVTEKHLYVEIAGKTFECVLEGRTA